MPANTSSAPWCRVKGSCLLLTHDKDALRLSPAARGAPTPLLSYLPGLITRPGVETKEFLR